MRFKYIKRIPVIVIAYILLSGCVNSEGKSFDNLLERVNMYYQYEAAGNWDKTYSYRTPNYRQVVPLDSYIKNMEKMSEGWSIEETKILSSSNREDKYYFSIEFTEAFTKDSKSEVVTRKIVDESVWVYVDGDWYCYDAAERLRLPLNGVIVLEN